MFLQLVVAINTEWFVFREVKDSRFIPEKMSTKHAKELFDKNNEYEIKYRRFFSGKSAVSSRLFFLLLIYTGSHSHGKAWKKILPWKVIEKGPKK